MRRSASAIYTIMRDGKARVVPGTRDAPPSQEVLKVTQKGNAPPQPDIDLTVPTVPHRCGMKRDQMRCTELPLHATT